MHHPHQPRGKILHDTNAKVLVPHCVDADPALAEPPQHVPPRRVEHKHHLVLDPQLVGEQAEFVDALGIVVVADGAEEDEFRAGFERGGGGEGGVQEVGEGAEEEVEAFLGAELRDGEDVGVPGAGGDGDCGGDFGGGARGEDGFDGVGCAGAVPEGADVSGCPGRVGHDDVDGGAAGAVDLRKERPVVFLELELDAGGGGAAGEGLEHICGDGGVVHVCGDGDAVRAEEVLDEGVAEGVAHRVDEDVWDEERERRVGEREGPEGLQEEGEVRVETGGDEAPVRDVDEDDAGGVEGDAEAVLFGGGLAV